jgi:hypothetical protein
MCPQAARPRSSVIGAFLARAAMRHGTLDVVSIRNMRLVRKSLKKRTGQGAGWGRAEVTGSTRPLLDYTVRPSEG